MTSLFSRSYFDMQFLLSLLDLKRPYDNFACSPAIQGFEVSNLDILTSL